MGYFESTQAAAGTWATNPAFYSLLKQGDKKTGDVIQTVVKRDGAVAVAGTIIPRDNTIPQNTEGDSYISVQIAPQSAINQIIVEANLNFSCNGNTLPTMALFKDAGVNAVAASAIGVNTINTGWMMPYAMIYAAIAGVTTQIAWTIRAGPNAAANMTFNGEAGAGLYNGTSASIMTATEIMV